MKRIHWFGLLGIGALGLAMLAPSHRTETAPPNLLTSNLATSPVLLEYLEERLRPTEGSNSVPYHRAKVDEPITRSEASGETQPPSLPETSSAANAQFKVQSNRALNVRAGPNKHTEKLFVLQPGTRVLTGHTQGSWVNIVTLEGDTGWVFAPYLERPMRGEVRDQEALRDPPRKPKSKMQASRFILANDTALKAGPAKSYGTVSMVPRGTKLAVFDWDGAWAGVVLDDGSQGWIKVR